MAAMREMARVLAPGGRVCLNVWGALERQPFFVAAIEAIGEFLGADAQKPFYLAFSLIQPTSLGGLLSMPD